MPVKQKANDALSWVPRPVVWMIQFIALAGVLVFFWSDYRKAAARAAQLAGIRAEEITSIEAYEYWAPTDRWRLLTRVTDRRKIIEFAEYLHRANPEGSQRYGSKAYKFILNETTGKVEFEARAVPSHHDIWIGEPGWRGVRVPELIAWIDDQQNSLQK